MKRLLHLSVILLLLAGSIGAGHARGQVRIAGQVVLCAGGTVTTVTVDQQGRPATATVVCPDMALSLLAGLADASEDHRGGRPARSVAWRAPVAAIPAATTPPKQARAPPVAG